MFHLAITPVLSLKMVLFLTQLALAHSVRVWTNHSLFLFTNKTILLNGCHRKISSTLNFTLRAILVGPSATYFYQINLSARLCLTLEIFPWHDSSFVELVKFAKTFFSNVTRIQKQYAARTSIFLLYLHLVYRRHLVVWIYIRFHSEEDSRWQRCFTASITEDLYSQWE